MRTHDGHRLDVTTYGPADARVTVFLAHCWTLNQHDWHYQVRDLQREFGHRVRIVTWDHRGHGGSDDVRRREATIELLARDWADLIDALAPTGPLVLAGHSIGGMTPDGARRPPGPTSSSGWSGWPSSPRRRARWTPSPSACRRPARCCGRRSRGCWRCGRARCPAGPADVHRSWSAWSCAGSCSDARCAWPTPPWPSTGSSARPPRRWSASTRTACATTGHTRCRCSTASPPTCWSAPATSSPRPSHARRIAEHVPGAVLTVAPDAGHMLPLERDALVSGVLGRLVRPHL